MQEKHRNTQIQSLRGIFCLMIILFHFTCRYATIYRRDDFFVHAFSSFSLIALFGFLCISGYYVEGKDTGWNFFLGKLKRLYPGYIVAITIIFLFQLTGFLGEERSMSFLKFLLNISFLNVVTGSGFVDGAHWYVVFLIAVYFIYAFLKKKKFYYEDVFLICNTIALIVTITGLQIIHKQSNSILNYMNYYFAFVLGLSIRRYKYEKIKKNNLPIIILLDLLYLVLSRGIIQSLITFVTFIGLWFILYEKITFLEKTKFLQYIGDRSYVIYLLHQNIGFIIMNFLLSIGFKNNILIIACAVILVITFSCLVYEGLKRLNIKC